MLKVSKILIVVVLVSSLTAVVDADMVPISKLDCENCSTQAVRNHQDCQGAYLLNSYDFNSAIDLSYTLSGQLLSNEGNNAVENPHAQNPIVLKDKQSSLILCLSALIGMGFCSSAHWMKKHSLAFIPEWYHSGGPHQIGHSFAATPDLLCNTPASYFVEPVYSVEDSLEQFHIKIIVSLWRKSQFTPIVLASRAPPNMS